MAWPQPYTLLPEAFYQRIRPTPVPDPYPVAWNAPLARELGIEGTPAGDADLLALLAGHRVPEGADPIATGYAGHQFGTWVPELGDGRAILLGEIGGQEIQLKGSGLTRWSRMGDGRAVLRSSIREYLASAAMTGLGIPTTRALAIIGSDLPVHRERTETAAVLTRTAPTHVRFGTFQWLASLRRDGDRQRLADWVIERHRPSLLTLPAARRYAAWYRDVVTRTARLMAEWIAVGFAHGVMNTDNFSILGLTLDYGPFGWLDRYDPAFVCNHTDWAGRYAFDQQPMVGLWNCARLGEALHPMVEEADALAALEEYRDVYQQTVLGLLAGKIGLVAREDDDTDLIAALLARMQEDGADYTRTFRALSRWPMEAEPMLAEFGDRDAIGAWLERYAARLDREPRNHVARSAAMLRTNPKYVLRNWVAEEVIQNAETRNHELVDQVRAVLDAPYDEHPAMERYAAAPPEWAKGIVVSCSS